MTGTSTRLLLQPLLLTITLFLGPIYTSICLERSSFSYHDFNDLQAFRNLIIGPLTEEIVFRGCIIAVSLITPLDQRPSAARIIFISPLWFGAGEDFFFFTSLIHSLHHSSLLSILPDLSSYSQYQRDLSDQRSKCTSSQDRSHHSQ